MRPTSRLLYCEGDERSPDVSVLRALLRGLPVTVAPVGSRGAFAGLLARDPSARALRDGDFPDDPASWEPLPGVGRWELDGCWVGWQWRRKEIENYLVDPEVVSRTFGWDTDRRHAYETLLRAAMAACAERTAARMALLGLLPRFERPVVRRFDPGLSGERLSEELRLRHRRARQAPALSEEALIARFHALLPLCLPGGPCHHPWVIAGKDLVGAFARMAGVRDTFPELVDTAALAGAVIAGLERDPAAHTWVPEWNVLRTEVGAWLGP